MKGIDKVSQFFNNLSRLEKAVKKAEVKRGYQKLVNKILKEDTIDNNHNYSYRDNNTTKTISIHR
jgi:hypothetical protein